MNTFERYFQRFPAFVDKILAWQPDFVVPAAKKGCKLLKSYDGFERIRPDLIKYKTFFELSNQAVKGKRIAVLDDATQYTSTLQEYRRYFENLGATVRTFSFVGHEKLFEGKRWQYDEQAEVEVFLPDPVYQEYILQQSYFLLNSGNHFDLDHLIFEVNLDAGSFEGFLSYLRSRGVLVPIESYFLTKPMERFSLSEVEFFDFVPFLSDPSITIGPIRKIKFNFDPSRGKLLFSPLVFPTWKFKGIELGSKLFRSVPFSLPFDIPRLVDSKNSGTLLRIYNNIYFAHVVSLAKAFIQDVRTHIDLCTDLRIRRNDLDAILGLKEAQVFMSAITNYVCNSETEDFCKPVTKTAVRKRKPKYHNFGEVIDELRRGYLTKVRKKKTRLGVHHFISYESLFRQYENHISLSENIDYYCDFGVIVPEILSREGRLLRVIRSGEPVSEYNWKRTQVLIPLAIEQHRLESQTNANSIDPMALNKMLSNFVFDYPSQEYHELHCLIGEPYTFGTLVRVYHHHRSPSKPSLYQTERISPYYQWNDKQKNFRIRHRAEMIKMIGTLFDERQEVPYSEILSYFRLFSRIHNVFKTVDVLNMLSICREENYFYSHVLFNVRSWLESYGLYLDGQQSMKRKALYDAGTHAHSALDKLRLARNIDGFMKTISGRFGGDVEFIKTVGRLNANYIPFTAQFRETLKDLDQLINLQIVLTNISLFVETKKISYSRKLQKLEYQDVLSSMEIAPPLELSSLRRDQEEYQSLVKLLQSKVRTQMESLKSEEPLLITRLQNVARTRATNIATIHVYRQELLQAIFLFMDFSGLRTIPEPKEEVISRYYSVVEKLGERRGGVKLYGGRGGDDAFTFIFTDTEPALQCAKDIKKAFSEDLFLQSSGGDIKFGVSYVILPEKQKEQAVLSGWGNAKDCCEYKGNGFRNRGDLLISEETLSNLESKNQLSMCERFERIHGESLKGTAASQIFRFKEIEPFPLH